MLMPFYEKGSCNGCSWAISKLLSRFIPYVEQKLAEANGFAFILIMDINWEIIESIYKK